MILGLRLFVDRVILCSRFVVLNREERIVEEYSIVYDNNVDVFFRVFII